MLNILDVDITIPIKKFDSLVDEYLYNHASDDYSFNYEEKITKSSKNLYQVNFENSDNAHKFSILGKRDGNSIKFTPMQIGGEYKKSYYTDHNPSNDILEGLVFGVMEEIAKEQKGDFICIQGSAYSVIQKGRDFSKRITGIGLIDRNGKVYTTKTGNDNDDDTDVDDYDIDSYVPTYLLNEWLEENEQFREKLQGQPKEDQFDIMGQYAVYQKKKDMITANQFRDIILQVGSLADMTNGFKNQSLREVYQLYV